MTRQTLRQLEIKLLRAQPIVSTMWQHKSGTVYLIIGVSIRESDGALLYTYQPADARTLVQFTRPADEWEAVPEGETAPRFIPWRPAHGVEV